ncbi:hypothetical protein TNCV_356661 [Trichonephila clavipes]|nr:hypothetical protein TNCV_356661 [Trichonephila clavipes]
MTIVLAYRPRHTPSLLIQSKDGSQSSWCVRLIATAGSDVVQSGRPIFDDFFQHLWPYIGNNTAYVVFQMVVAYAHRPMTLHSPTENSL